MNFRGLFGPAISLCVFIIGAVYSIAESETSSDLKYESQPLKGGVLDLIYPGQDTGGAANGTNQNSDNTAGGVQSLQGDVTDLKAAGADIKESASEIKISLQGEILFDFDKANLRPAAEPTLTQIVALIRKTPKPMVVIEGYTDSKGAPAYNQKLSDRRAASVKAWMVAHGIADGGVRTRGLGAANPIVPNKKPDGSDDPEGRQKNRRVEITIKK
jgi:outer membrane protein OmpA-like peptidoglycan-associated protein